MRRPIGLQPSPRASVMLILLLVSYITKLTLELFKNKSDCLLSNLCFRLDPIASIILLAPIPLPFLGLPSVSE